MAATAEHVYVCKTCGKTQVEGSHLCNPVPIEEGVKCNYCGQMSREVWHMCARKLSGVDYVCTTCGRVAVESDSLCYPHKIVKGELESYEAGPGRSAL